MAVSDREPTQGLRALLRLRELVLSGALAPGERISEIPLANRLGVSRTPLRLALSRLEAEGLVEPLAGGGFVVREFTQADIADAIELRGVHEGTAARLAAERLGRPRELATLRRCCAQLDTVVRDRHRPAASFARYVTLNETFHAEMLALAHSPILARSLERIVALPFASASAFVMVQAELPESWEILFIAQEHHRAIVDAIEHREGSRAESVAREHSRLARRNLQIALENRDVLDRVPGGALIRLPQEAGAA